MTPHTLATKTESARGLGQFFQSAGSKDVHVEVCEDRCFGESRWLDLGRIVLKPGSSEDGEDPTTTAIAFGFFEWRCADEESLHSEAFELLELKGPANEEQRAKARRALDSIAHAACRVGLIHPVLDAAALCDLPFRSPATVVVDTSAIVHGGLDFVVRFLYPMARIKVPAIAHMELLNSADNYFNMRRKGVKGGQRNWSGRALFEHALSQGGQRALLRLELQTDTEIERGRLGADPLRGVVEMGADPEDKKLGLSILQRSFADRLIFETARQHAAQCMQNHAVLVMTCDQGLARMTIAEGMQPLYFESGGYDSISGRVLTGTSFNPFTGRVYGVSLSSLLWELAVTFGMSRLRALSGDVFEVGAIGSSMPWKPYHAREDLLWSRLVCSAAAADVTASPGPPIRGAESQEPDIPKVGATARGERQGKAGGSRAAPEPGVAQPASRGYSGSYRFNPTRMLNLLAQLSQQGHLAIPEALAALDLASASQLDDYRNFLASGGFLVQRTSELRKTEWLDELWNAIAVVDTQGIAAQLLRVPSFERFISFIKAGTNAAIPGRALSTYIVLAEISCLGMNIPGERVFPTPANPKPLEFRDIALSAYRSLSLGAEDYVLTGLWLEALVRGFGIHPIVARQRLQESVLEDLLERYTEGSTPETRYRAHALHVLRLVGGKPVIEKVALFEGDLLLPGKSSVSIRLVRKDE